MTKSFQPTQHNLFETFQYHMSLLRQALDLLEDAVTDTRYPTEVVYSEIRKLEREGDEILRGIVRQLDRQDSDYPPREEVRRLSYQQDRILDAVERLAGRLAAFRLGRLPDPAVRLMTLIHSCACALANSIEAVGDAKRFREQIAGMAELENEADRLYVDAIRELFGQEKDPVRLVQLNELYGLLERVVNLFEDCIQAMEDVVLRAFAGFGGD